MLEPCRATYFGVLDEIMGWHNQFILSVSSHILQRWFTASCLFWHGFCLSVIQSSVSCPWYPVSRNSKTTHLHPFFLLLFYFTCKIRNTQTPSAHLKHKFRPIPDLHGQSKVWTHIGFYFYHHCQKVFYLSFFPTFLKLINLFWHDSDLMGIKPCIVM